MAATNEELRELVGLELGVDLMNRRPTAKMIWKWQDLDLLPHSSTGTLLGELYEWSGRNWRTTQNNLSGIIFSPDQLGQIKTELLNVPKENANIPDFEFTKDDLVELDFSLPSIFNIGLKGNVKNLKNISVKINGVTKARLTNMDQPGIKIYRQLSLFAQNNSAEYRKKIKSDYITTALFYAESVEIDFEKEAGTDLELKFEVEQVNVETSLNTETKKNVKLSYNGNLAPFAATFVKVKALDF